MQWYIWFTIIHCEQEFGQKSTTWEQSMLFREIMKASGLTFTAKNILSWFASASAFQEAVNAKVPRQKVKFPRCCIFRCNSFNSRAHKCGSCQGAENNTLKVSIARQTFTFKCKSQFDLLRVRPTSTIIGMNSLTVQPSLKTSLAALNVPTNKNANAWTKQS